MSKKLRFFYVLIVLLASVSLALTGCEVDDDADADAGGATSSSSGTTSSSSSTSSGTTTFQKYFYVKIEDHSTLTTGDDPGADIAGLVLTKPDGSTSFADETVAYSPADTLTDLTRQEALLGPPTASFPDWESGDTTTCDVTSANFTPLGGVGGSVIVSFTKEIADGDTLDVYEVGNCEWSGGTAKPDPISVSVSIAADPDGTWVPLVSNAEGPVVTSGVISGLPQVP